jgi:hypothetical protein
MKELVVDAIIVDGGVKIFVTVHVMCGAFGVNDIDNFLWRNVIARQTRRGWARGRTYLTFGSTANPVCTYMSCTHVLSHLLGANAFTFSESLLLEGWSGQSEEIWNYEFATRFGNCNLGLLRSFWALRAQISKLAQSLRTIPRIAPVSSCHSC